jgi:hypothetical protein
LHLGYDAYIPESLRDIGEQDLAESTTELTVGIEGTSTSGFINWR